MKYGRLAFTRMAGSRYLCNVGDIIQIMAIDRIFDSMGISEDEIVEIGVEEMQSYHGEPIVLPINGYFKYSAQITAFPTSPDIIPVFLGLYSTSGKYLTYKKFWKKAAPIGCRDEATRGAMRKAGYDAYLLGCMTLTLPRRTQEPENPKVFLVDAHPSILQYIPEKLKESMVRMTHDVPVNKTHTLKRQRAELRRKTAEIYTRYQKEAGLVITSRLHCAAPCIAMGIPVIVARDNFDERFGWLDKFIHLYTPDEYDQIDWDPKPLDLEDHKKKLIQAAESMIRRRPDRALLEEIDDFYMHRDRKPLKGSLMVRGYNWLAQYCPGLATFIRTKLLARFTITASSKE